MERGRWLSPCLRPVCIWFTTSSTYTIAGIDSVPEDTLNAAYGMGMWHAQIIFKIDISPAAKIIVSGIRVSVIINIGTVMIGAGGLGIPIMTGLLENNLAYFIEGAVPAAILAILATVS